MKPNTPAPRTFRGLPAIALALAALGLSQPAAQAELLTNTWTNASGDFKWNNDDLASVGRNWTLLSPSPVDSSLQPIWVDGDDAVFGATGAGAISLGTVNTVHNLTVNAAGYAFSGSALTFAGDIPTLTANADFGLGVGLMGSAGLTIQGTGAVTLNPTGPSTYTGGTRVLGGTVILKAGTSANTASSFALHKIEQLDAGATVKYYNELQLSPLDNLRAPNGQLYNKTDMVMTGGTFDLNGDNNQNQMPAPSGYGIITNSSPNDRAVLRIGAAANTTREFSGIIQDGGPVVASPISGKVGFQTHIDLASFDNSAAEIVLSGPNTYTGSTRRGGGHLKLKGAGTLGVVTAGTPSIGLRINGDNNLPAEVDFNGTSQRVSGMGGNGGKIVNDMADTTSVLTLGVAPDHVDTAVASWVGSFRDNSGTGGILAVTKIGTNKQILTGSLHSYSGPTRINEGTIEFGTSAAPSPNSDHYVASPGKLSLLYAGSKPIKRLILNGVQVGLGTYDALSYPEFIEGPGSIEVTDATDIAAPPSPPTDLAATAGDSQVALTWTAAFQATGDYNIKRSETSGAGYLTIGTASGTSYTDSTAVNDTTYYYVVSATNGAGEGDNSTEVSATPVLPLPPAPPTNLAVIAGNQQISLSWMASAGATGYTVKRSLTSGEPYTDEFAVTTTSYVDGPLDNATTYFYVVSASNSGGTSGISAEVSATPSASVINVGDPSFEIGGASQKALGKDTPIVAPWGPGGGWGYPYTPPGEPTGGLYATDGVYMAYCNSDSTLSQTLTDTLLPNTLYTLSVDVGRRNDLGMPGYSISLYAGSTLLASASGGSNSFSPGWITAVATYASPSSVTPDQTLKIVLGGKGVQIEFDNVRLSATEIAAPPSPPTDLAATAGDSQVALTWTASSQATGDYNIKRSETSGAGYLTIGTASGASYTDSTAVNDTTYYYVVSATNGAGEGDNSTEVSATPVLPLPPAPPTNLAVIAGNQQISLSWMVSAGAAGYTVKRSLTSGGPYTDEFAATTTTYVDGPLDNATTYYYVVSASNSVGQGVDSAEVSATPSASVINVGDPSFEIGGASQKALGKDTPIVAPWGPGGGWGYPYTPPGEPTGGLYATDGVYMAYCNSDSTLSQTLTDTLQPNTLYTLSVDVGRRSDLDMPGYSISLYAGSTLLASASGASNSFAPGWITAVATYASPSSVTPDQTLTIVLGGKGVQTEFDNVRLDATAASAADYTTWAADQNPPITGGPVFVGHDGITNLLLYALDLKLDGTNGSPGTLTGNELSFAKRPDAVANNDVTYAIETSSDLGVTDPWIAATPDVNDAATISYTLPTGSGGKLFARLVVTQK